MLCSVIGPGTSLKALHATLACKATTALAPDVPGEANMYRLIHDSAGYDRHLSKIAYGTHQMMLVSRCQGFLPEMSAASLWRVISGERFTTPLLRAWLPWIERELLDRELLLPLRCFNCKCGWLKATSDDLDGIVGEGLRTNKLVIA